MDVSIIIVNYNTCQMTGECIDSIFNNTKGVSFEVILVDNASADESKTKFQNDKRIKYVYSFENMGFGRANNVGMMLAKGEYYLLLNSDTQLKNNAIKLFYDYAITHKRKAIYGCWLEDADDNFIHSCAKMPTYISMLNNKLNVYRGRFGKKINDVVENISYTNKECIEVGYITGADMFLHRSIYEETGGFDHHFFMYFEECDWQLRAGKIGFKSYCINGPQIMHLVHGSQKKNTWSNFAFKISLQSQYYYVKRHHNIPACILYRVLNTILLIPIVLTGRSLKSKDRLISLIELFK
jgi:GT2 family glycosyltransferase